MSTLTTLTVMWIKKIAKFENCWMMMKYTYVNNIYVYI